MGAIYIETERLILRSWEAADRQLFAELNASKSVMKYFPNPLSVEESDDFADRIEKESEETGIGLYAVEIKETGEFIDYVGFHRFSFDAPFSPGWEIGWRISDIHWHNGYATEAAKARIDFAREKKFCEKIYSFTAIQNTPSENVMKRIGMKFEGTFMHPADSNDLSDDLLRQFVPLANFC